MNAGKALAIVKNIEKAPFSDNEKAIAIYEVMQMPTHNSISKADMLNVIKWLWNKHDTMEQGENDTPITNYERIMNMSADEFASNYFTLTTNYCEHPETCKKVKWENGRTPCENCLIKWLESEAETE